ncbi:MAG TPA: SIMPL domain-containing protein [Candidatus Cybelea sp.]
MKRTFFCLLIAVAATTGGALAAQSGVTEITASGTGSVSLPPDMATVNAAVETNAARAADAVSQNNQIYERVVAALEKLGIARGDVALAYYNVNYNPPPQVMPAAPNGERYGYTVSRTFSVKVRSIGKAGAVSDACIGAGATGINGISFGLADPSSARAQAIAKAQADARNAAQALARSANVRIVAVKSLELQNGGMVGPPVPMGAMARAAAPTVFDQSNVSVSVSVTVVFTARP